MPIQRKHDFQPGMKISSSHMDDELNQFVAQLNKIESDDDKKDALLRSIAQLTKITNDLGEQN